MMAGRVLITGVSSDIGLALCRHFLSEGFTVTGQYYTNHKNIEAFKKTIKETDCIEFFSCDLRRPDVVSKQFGDHIKASPPSIFIHGAAQFDSKALYAIKESEISAILDVNLLSFFVITRRLIKPMMRKGGNIIAISSIAATIGLPGQSVYSASKAGLIAAVQSLAKEVGNFNIRVNAIVPGQIESGGQSNSKNMPTPPLRRKGTPDDIAKLALFLTSENAAYITGAAVDINGGLP